jgi:predicted small metal-binding protein
MTGSTSIAHLSFACRDAGFACDWRLRAASAAEIEARFREHAKCAHASGQLSDDLSARIASAIRPW